MSEECARCDGSGTITCPRCDGKGEVRASEYCPVLSEVLSLVNSEFDGDKECPKCEGTGQFTCPTCEGSGRV
jgi:DnaJ-class molecular chaperone